MTSEGLIVSVTGANGYPIVDLFDDLDLQEGLLRGINSYGFEKPSAIQQRGIRPVLDGRDTIGQAQSETGKTATFVIGSCQRVDHSLNACQALILAPTRELAQQIHKVVLALGDYLNVRCHACIGGTSVRDDIDKLRDGQHVVVGTPGRVFDMLSKRHLRIDDLLTFVCDEADVMLSRGFKDQIYDIFKTLPPNVQVCLFSATMAPEILELTTCSSPANCTDSATPTCDPVSNGEYSGTCVSTAPVAEPTVMLFTVPLSDSTIAATATAVTTFCLQPTAQTLRPQCAVLMCVWRCLVVVEVSLPMVHTILFGTA